MVDVFDDLLPGYLRYRSEPPHDLLPDTQLILVARELLRQFARERLLAFRVLEPRLVEVGGIVVDVDDSPFRGKRFDHVIAHVAHMAGKRAAGRMRRDHRGPAG